MNGIGRQLIFVGGLFAVLLWSGQGELAYRLDWGPSDKSVVSLRFSAQDSLLLTHLTFKDKPSGRKPATDNQAIAIFDKLVYLALWEKCCGNPSGSEAYFHHAGLTASYFNETFASPLLSQALRFYTDMKDDTLKTKLLAERFFYQGCDFLQQRKFVEARNGFRASHQLYIKIRDTKRTIETASHLVYVALNLGDYAQGIDLAVRTLGTATRKNYDRQIRWLHWLLGETNAATSNYDEAKREFEIALQLAGSKSDTLLLTRTYERLGLNYWSQGDFLKALEAMQRSQHFSHNLGDQSIEINCWIGLGMINRRLGNYVEANQCYEKAYALNHELAQPHLNAVIENNWAGLYIELGDWKRTLDLYMQALYNEQAERDPQIRYIVAYYSNIGLIYSKLGENEKTLEYQKLALKELGKLHTAASEEALIYLRMGDSHREMGQRQEAEDCYTAALTISENTKEVTTQILSLLGLGSFFSESGELDRSLSLQEQALRLAQQTQSPDLEWNAALELGKTYEAMNEINSAQRSFECALEKVETSRTKIFADTLRMSFFAAKQDVYERLIGLHLNAKKDSKTALHYSERSRARTMLDFLGERFGNTRAISNVPQLQELQTHMASDMAFVEYKFLPEQMVIWVIKRNGLEVATVAVTRPALAKLVQKFLETIGARNFEIFRARYAKEPERLFDESVQLGERLYRYLVTPIEKYLSSQQIIYFIADDILHYLPFSALTIPEAEPQRFLIEKYKVAYIPSLAVYNYLAKRQTVKPETPGKKMLVVGNPTGDLANSEKEARFISTLFPGSKLLLGEQATEQAIMAGLQSDIDCFHFAGHCRINEKSPIHSALLLFSDQSAKSFGNGDNGVLADGMLTVQDLASCSFDHLNLVTLSACETALGMLFKGEGMMGFSQILLGTGISTLVSSLWKVDDRISAELMEDFYRYLVAAKHTKVSALREAQLDKIIWCRRDSLVKKPFPYFWAFYVLNGLI